MRWFAASLLLLAMVATLPEIHRGNHESISALDNVSGGQIVRTSLHPDRPTPCLERAVLETIPRCAACQLRIQGHGDSVLRPLVVELPAPPTRVALAFSALARSSEQLPPPSRGPPILL
jgi:hypothetical protein